MWHNSMTSHHRLMRHYQALFCGIKCQLKSKVDYVATKIEQVWHKEYTNSVATTVLA